MRVAIYARVSTNKQELKNQIEICEKFCEARGWEIFKIYHDVSSGARESRPAFNQMLNDMRHYKFRVLVIYKLDRIGRSLKHLLSLFDEFQQKKVEVAAVTQNIDTTTSAGKLQMQIIGAFAEFERNIISERTKDGLKHAKNVGKRGPDKKPRKKRGGRRTDNFYS